MSKLPAMAGLSIVFALGEALQCTIARTFLRGYQATFHAVTLSGRGIVRMHTGTGTAGPCIELDSVVVCVPRKQGARCPSLRFPLRRANRRLEPFRPARLSDRSIGRSSMHANTACFPSTQQLATSCTIGVGTTTVGLPRPFRHVLRRALDTFSGPAVTADGRPERAWSSERPSCTVPGVVCARCAPQYQAVKLDT